jgi:PAS domain S-box-containing protein
MAQILFIITVILLILFVLLVFNFIRRTSLLSQRHQQSEDIIFNSIFEAIIQTDEKMTITRWNRRAEEIFGWKPEEVRNKPIHLFLKGTDPESWTKYRRVLLSTGSNQEEFLQQTKSGKLINIGLSSALLKDKKGKILGTISVIRDITIRKKQFLELEERSHTLEDMLEQQLAESEEKNQQLKELNGRLQEIREKEKENIAHELFDELGQDLSSVKIQLSLVRDDIGDAESKILFDHSVEKIEDIFQSIKKLSTGLMPKMISDLGFPIAMEEYCLQFQLRTGVKTSIQLKAPCDKLTHQQEMMLFQCSDKLLKLMSNERNLRLVKIESYLDNDFIYNIIFHGTELKKIESILEIREKIGQSGMKISIDSNPKQSSVIFLIPISH